MRDDLDWRIFNIHCKGNREKEITESVKEDQDVEPISKEIEDNCVCHDASCKGNVEFNIGFWSLFLGNYLCQEAGNNGKGNIGTYPPENKSDTLDD